ncbi:MAG: helix-turn-helix domain-containing protein [Candidatus Palauibacterales bacterium]|nr:helix-turn-helix domain-containing protein [Candidatus Palauibacterales bacterium]
MKPERDEKARALKEHRALNPKPEQVKDERFRSEEFFDPRDLVQVKYEMLRRVHEEGATVTEAAETFGFSRPTFYHAQEALTEEGLAGLAAKRPGPRAGHKLTGQVLDFVEELRMSSPAAGAQELSERIEERFGLLVHPRSIERALARREKKRRQTG